MAIDDWVHLQHLNYVLAARPTTYANGDFFSS